MQDAKRETRYAIVRIDNGVHHPHTGVVSNHRTEDAARKLIERFNRKLRQQAGYANSWHPYAILDRKTGRKTV